MAAKDCGQWTQQRSGFFAESNRVLDTPLNAESSPPCRGLIGKRSPSARLHVSVARRLSGNRDSVARNAIPQRPARHRNCGVVCHIAGGAPFRAANAVEHL